MCQVIDLMKIKRKMKMKLHSTVFKIAHQIKAQFKNWSEAVKTAWKLAKITLGRVTDFTFLKVDEKTGEAVERPASPVGFGNLETIKKGFVRFKERIENGTEQWRAFKIKHLI